MDGDLLHELADRAGPGLTSMVYIGVIGLASMLGEGDRLVLAAGAGVGMAGVFGSAWVWYALAHRTAEAGIGDAHAVAAGPCGQCGGEVAREDWCMDCGSPAPRSPRSRPLRWQR